MRLAIIIFAFPMVAQPARVFEKVWATVNEKYYDASHNGADWAAAREAFQAKAAAARNDEELYKILNEMLRRLNDRHTSAIPPSVVKQEQSRSALRIGFGMQLVEGRWVIKAVDPNSSAYEAGVAPGWVLEKMAGIPMPQRTGEMAAFDETIRYRSRCDAGQPIALALRDPADKPREVAVTCRKLSITPKHEARMLDKGVLYLRQTRTAGWRMHCASTRTQTPPSSTSAKTGAGCSIRCTPYFLCYSSRRSLSAKSPPVPTARHSAPHAPAAGTHSTNRSRF
jgi:C-terminal processing protease CtpA/Prc